MIPAVIPGWNREFKAPEGATKAECGNLRVRVQRYEMGGRECFAFTSAWTPDPAELARLNAGASIHLTVLGATLPPVSMAVGEPVK